MVMVVLFVLFVFCVVMCSTLTLTLVACLHASYASAVKPPKGDEVPVCVLQDFKQKQEDEKKKAKEDPPKKKAKPMKQIRIGVKH